MYWCNYAYACCHTTNHKVYAQSFAEHKAGCKIFAFAVLLLAYLMALLIVLAESEAGRL